MIAIIDYGVGNLFSLQSSFEAIGADIVITDNEKLICSSERIVLPGVGAFGDAIDKLRSKGLDSVLINEAKNGKPILGICLGMQMLFERSFEYGEHKGLGLLKGEIVPMEGYLDPNLKIPHIGWNKLQIKAPSVLLKYVKENDFVYFVHSYFAKGCEDSLIADTDYGKPITAAVENGNIMGAQFHPEKSGEVGLNILRAFCEGESK